MNPPAAGLRIFVVDDSSIVRRGLTALLEEDARWPRLSVVGQAGTVAEAIAGIRDLRPDLALIDVRLPDGVGMTVCRSIEAENLRVHSLVITSYPNDDYIRDAIAAGALGYVLKDVDPEALLAAVRACARGESAFDQGTINRVVRLMHSDSRPPMSVVDRLSDQERRVMGFVAEGLTNSGVAEKLGLSPHTVKNHLANIFEKLGVANRAEAVALLLRSENDL